MRELYAVALHSTSATNADAAGFIDFWLERHEGPEYPERPAGEVQREADSAGRRLAVMTQVHSANPSLLWHTEIALGAPEKPLDFQLRIGLTSSEFSGVTPFEFEFAAPALVRTLLREMEIVDAGQRVSPSYLTLGASQVPELVALLFDPLRALPVIVVTGEHTAGRHLVDPYDLAMQLAGLAHVRVLSSEFATRRLATLMGSELAVWGGAVRVYFPGFRLDSAPRSHRLWLPHRVSDHLVREVRRWLSALAAAQIPPHPVHASLRAEHHAELRKSGQDISVLYEMAEEAEASAAERQTTIRQLEVELAEAKEELADSQEEVFALRREWGAFVEATAPMGSVEAHVEGREVRTIDEAVASIEDLLDHPSYAGKVTVRPQALRVARDFSVYRRPAELLRAVHAVLDAGARFHDDRLGEPPKDCFERQGFAYGAEPEPHLKVDEGTSPDQCLRIYWNVDDSRRMWSINHIGRHK